jgi:hypothetical protein
MYSRKENSRVSICFMWIKLVRVDLNELLKLTVWIRELPEKLIVAQLVKKLPASC